MCALCSQILRKKLSVKSIEGSMLMGETDGNQTTKETIVGNNAGPLSPYIGRTKYEAMSSTASVA